MKKVLVVAAHCDDEILGCGGTISKHRREGDIINVLILCDQRHDQSIAASQNTGHSVWFGDFEDQKFDTVSILSITKQIEIIRDIIKPEIVYTHYMHDLNLDHEITARATLTACRPLPKSTVEEIYGFEIPSSTEWGAQPFFPNHYVSLEADDRYKKTDALKCFGHEIKPNPHARSMTSIEAMGLKRGAECGVEFAEAFHTYRTIRRK